MQSLYCSVRCNCFRIGAALCDGMFKDKYDRGGTLRPDLLWRDFAGLSLDFAIFVKNIGTDIWCASGVAYRKFGVWPCPDSNEGIFAACRYCGGFVSYHMVSASDDAAFRIADDKFYIDFT